MAYYKLKPAQNKKALLVTIEGANDLLMLYGTEILKDSDKSNMTATTTSNDTVLLNTTGRRAAASSRKLYNADEIGDLDANDAEEITFRDVLDFLADLMDDEVKIVFQCKSIQFKLDFVVVRRNKIESRGGDN